MYNVNVILKQILSLHIDKKQCKYYMRGNVGDDLK